MNIKKKNLYLELYPITYNDKKYMCTISRRKDFIFRFILNWSSNFVFSYCKQDFVYVSKAC